MAEREGAPSEATEETSPSVEVSPDHNQDTKTDSRRAKMAESAKEDERSAAARIKTAEDRLNQPISPEEEEKINEGLRQDRRSHARANLEQWKAGRIQEIEPNDLAIIIQDLAESGQESALAELVLSKQGFKNFEDALRQLKLKEVTYGDTKVTLKDSNWQRFIHSPAVKEQITKLGLSGGTSVAVAGLITLLGGPVSWGVVAAGVAGGAAGRAAGEFVRGRMLNRKEKGSTIKTGPADEMTMPEMPPMDEPAPKRFNEVVAEDLLQQIINLQSQAKEFDGLAETNPNARAQAMLELVRNAADVESRSSQRYQKMEKNARFIKAGLAVLGAVGGSIAASAIVGHEAAGKAAELSGDKTFHAQLLEAKKHGLRIYHDTKGAHITTDVNAGHLVKETADHAWRFAIEHKDTAAAALEAKREGLANYGDIFHYYTGHGPNLPVPNSLGGHEFLHASVVNDVPKAIKESLQLAAQDIQAKALLAELMSSLVVTAPAMLWEAGWLEGQERRRSETKADNELLISSLAEIDAHLHNKILLGTGEETPVGRIPDNGEAMPDFLERFAKYYGIKRLPTSPAGLAQNWYSQLPQPEIAKVLPTLHEWGMTNPDGGFQLDENGQVRSVRIAEVDIPHNRVVIVLPFIADKGTEITRQFRAMRLDTFLQSHRQLADKQKAPAAAPTPEEEGSNWDNFRDRQPDRERLRLIDDSQTAEPPTSNDQSEPEDAEPDDDTEPPAPTPSQPGPRPPQPNPPRDVSRMGDAARDDIAEQLRRDFEGGAPEPTPPTPPTPEPKPTEPIEVVADRNVVLQQLNEPKTSPKIANRPLFGEDRKIYQEFFDQFAQEWANLTDAQKREAKLGFDGRQDPKNDDIYQDHVRINYPDGSSDIVKFETRNDGAIRLNLAHKKPNGETEWNNAPTAGQVIDLHRDTKQRLDSVEKEATLVEPDNSADSDPTAQLPKKGRTRKVKVDVKQEDEGGRLAPGMKRKKEETVPAEDGASLNDANVNKDDVAKNTSEADATSQRTNNSLGSIVRMKPELRDKIDKIKADQKERHTKPKAAGNNPVITQPAAETIEPLAEPVAAPTASNETAPLLVEKGSDLQGKQIRLEDPIQYIMANPGVVFSGELNPDDVTPDTFFTVEAANDDLVEFRLNGGRITAEANDLLPNIVEVKDQ